MSPTAATTKDPQSQKPVNSWQESQDYTIWDAALINKASESPSRGFQEEAGWASLWGGFRTATPVSVQEVALNDSWDPQGNAVACSYKQQLFNLSKPMIFFEENEFLSTIFAMPWKCIHSQGHWSQEKNSYWLQWVWDQDKFKWLLSLGNIHFLNCRYFSKHFWRKKIKVSL